MHPTQRTLLLDPYVDLEAIMRDERRIGQASRSENTKEAYFFAWRAFCLWCEAASLPSLPASACTVQHFSTWCLQAGYRINTVILRLSGIAHYHVEAGYLSPVTREIWHYIENAKRHFKEESRAKRAITCEMLRKIVARLPDTPTGTRNRAMILVAFAAGWRRTEVTGLRYSDLRFVPRGIELWLRSSKTDQTGKGRLIGIQPGDHDITCPVLALRAWIAIRGVWEGPLFPRISPQQEVTRDALARRGQVIHMALKRFLDAIGEDPRYFGAHSLRAGMITEAAKNGATEAAIMQRTGHKCSATLRRYIRPATAFDFNPLRGVL
jgi:integrase